MPPTSTTRVVSPQKIGKTPEDEIPLPPSSPALEESDTLDETEDAREDGGEDEQSDDSDDEEDQGEGGSEAGGAGPSTQKIVKPITAEALAEFEATQARAGVVYISRIPPAMRPTKVRHIMSGFGQIGRVYLQQEDAKRAHLRRKHTSTRKAHFTEGWVEFLDKRVGRSVAEMLNGQPIGGKKGTRWRDDVWTMKYLPRFKWNMLTEQVAHEAAAHTARLRVELSQSKSEQSDYLKQVELARVLAKRDERKRKREEETGVVAPPKARPARPKDDHQTRPEKKKTLAGGDKGRNGKPEDLENVLGSVF